MDDADKACDDNSLYLDAWLERQKSKAEKLRPKQGLQCDKKCCDCGVSIPSERLKAVNTERRTECEAISEGTFDRGRGL